MSTIRANNFLDAAGGNTAMINGVTPALATQVEAEAGTDNTKIMTPLRVDQAIAAQVGSATAGLSVGAVGSYAFMALSALSTSVITEGGTIAGSSLRYAGITAAAIAGSTLYSTNPASTTVPSGTWKAMGAVPNTGSQYRGTLFLRIS